MLTGVNASAGKGEHCPVSEQAGSQGGFGESLGEGES